jgi:pimeloyl-ACP methyl ester carboxylesterase
MLAVALLTASVWAGGLAASAQAQIAFSVCGDSNDYACGHLTVPLDPSGQTPGTITLAIRRHRAPAPSGNDAVIALAGGPGQSSIPLADNFTQSLGPIISTRDLIVFDQRGTGLSHPLSCPAFEKPNPHQGPGLAIPDCANQIGAQRALFTTGQSVADIEAIRQAGGYHKLVLYGTSYGTKVAEQYAQTYPTHVEALVLDSVVAPDDRDPLQLSTFAAVPRILTQLCTGNGCARITRHPSDDLSVLVRRLGRRTLHTDWIDGHGRAHKIDVSSDDLLNILMSGDFDPTLRADFPAAVRAAVDGDAAPLGRLDKRLGPGSGSDGINDELYATTVCEEQPFPWTRSDTPIQRLKTARSYAERLPAGSFGPFAARNALDLSDIGLCAFWPFATAAPQLDDAPLPNVPTLILSGANDLRTPTAEARIVAAEIPDSHLLVVPYVGHSVLGNDPSSCSSDALKALFAGTPIQACKTPKLAALSFRRPSPLPPRVLADVAPAKGEHGLAGRTLEAVTLTLQDASRQLLLQGNLFAKGGLRAGGLHSGSVVSGPGGVIVHDLSYVPGVTLNGSFVHVRGTLRIAGSAAAKGVLQIAGSSLRGVLGGQHVQLSNFAGALGPLLAVNARATATASRARR